MTLLETSTARKALIAAYLRPGNGGYPSLPGYGQKGKGGKYLFHKTEEIRAPKSINDTQQSLMLDLSLRQLGGHRSRVR